MKARIENNMKYKSQNNIVKLQNGNRLALFQKAVNAVQNRDAQALQEANDEATLIEQDDRRKAYNQLHQLPQDTRFVPSNGRTITEHEGPLYDNKLEKVLDDTAKGQLAVRMVNTLKKGVGLGFAVAGGNWLLNGLKAAPFLTSMELLGGATAGKLGQSVGKQIDNKLHTHNQIIDFEKVLPFISMIGGAKGARNWFENNTIRGAIESGFQNLKFIPAQVKYYGPTMGKTTAVKTNPNLIDFDDIMRKPSKDLLKKYGFRSKYEMFESENQDAIKEYQDLLISKMKEFKANPNNSGKTLVVSQSPVVNPEVTGFSFDNIPSIPSREIFIERNIGRGGDYEGSAGWYDNLVKSNPNLRIDNRFVSEIEGNNVIEFTPKQDFTSTYHLDPRVKLLSRPISESERLGIPKGERNQPIRETGYFQKLQEDAIKAVESRVSEPYKFKTWTLEEIKNEQDPEIRSNMEYSRKKALKEANDSKTFGHYITFDSNGVKQADAFSKMLQEYASKLPEVELIPELQSSMFDGIEIQSPTVKAYRDYLSENKFHANDVSNSDLAKFLQHEYNKLVSQQSGKVKGKLLWHGSPAQFDNFSLDTIGDYTSNNGAIGPGFYFSSTGSPYGAYKSVVDYSTHVPNLQPYLIDGIKSTPEGHWMREKGIIPEYIGPSTGHTSEQVKIWMQEHPTPKDNFRLFINPGPGGGGLYRDTVIPSEFMYRGDRIKSLFPHPSLLTRDNTGNIIMLSRSFEPGKLNYKHGGILKGQLGLSNLPVNPNVIKRTYDKANNWLNPIGKWESKYNVKADASLGPLMWLENPEAFAGVDLATIDPAHVGAKFLKEPIPKKIITSTTKISKPVVKQPTTKMEKGLHTYVKNKHPEDLANWEKYLDEYMKYWTKKKK